MTWRVANALEVLLAELNAAAPHRSKVSDGSIGDAAHAARTSDHNPWVIDTKGVGVVRARDFTHDPEGGLDGHVLAAKLAALLGVHPALGSGAYVIFNGQIISTDRKNEGWRPYTGLSAHKHHVHLSVATTWNRFTRKGYDSGKKWGVMETTKIRVRFASWNVLAAMRTRPGGSARPTYSMLGTKRIRLAILRWKARRLQVLTLQELQPPVVEAIRRRPLWDILVGAVNDPLGGCTGIAYRIDQFTARKLPDIVVRISEGRVLHMPVARMSHNKTGVRFIVIGWHAPANGKVSGGTATDRQLVNAAVFERAKLEGEKLPVLVGGDSNQPNASASFPGMKIGARSGVDLILGWHVKFIRNVVARIFKRLKLSDHPLVFSVVEIEK